MRTVIGGNISLLPLKSNVVNRISHSVTSIVLPFLFLLLFIIVHKASFAQTTLGPYNAGTGSNVAGIGTQAWTNAENIATAVTTDRAVVTPNQNGISNYLMGTNYGFAIPSNATINGITLVLGELRESGGGNEIYDYSVRLVKNGSVTGSDYSRGNSTNWTRDLGIINEVNYGGSGDLWGTTWTPADINASDFGAAISVSSPDNGVDAYVYYLSISVTYTILTSPYTMTSSGTFTVPAGVTSITVEAWGGGGGGSTITNNNRRGGGGGGGAYVSSVLSVTPGTTYNVVIGSGGAASTAGGNTTFGSTLVIAAGGSGGTNNSTIGGAGGSTSASTGDTKYAGGNGANGGGTYSGGGGGGAGTTGAGGNAPTPSAGSYGTGTSLYGGNGGSSVSGGSNGVSGSNFGGGGSGASTNSNTNRTGGSGAPGQVIISWTNSPVISVSPTSLDFGNTCIGSSAAENSFTISGSNLTTASVTIGALSGYAYSTNSGGPYSNSLSLVHAAGTYNQTVFVQFTPSTVTSYNGNIVVGGGGTSSNVNVAVSGNGVDTPPTVNTPASINITANSADLGGNIGDLGCSSVSEWGIYYSTISGFADGSGTKVSTTGSAVTGTFLLPVTGLTENTVYYFKAFATNSAGTVYTSEGSFTTLGPPDCSTPVTPTDLQSDVLVDGILTWNAVPNATGYKIFFGTDAGATNIENGTDLGNVTSYTPSSNLNFLTDYYWKVVPYNSYGAASGCSTWSFTTEGISYCSSFGDMTYGDGITLVSLNTINNISAKPAAYNDYMSISTDLIIGNSYEITINLNTDGPYTNGASAWIDWNINGVFEASEEYNLGSVTNNSNGATSNSPLTITVPITANPGLTRMRVSTKYNAYPTQCEVGFDGEVEDYSINILEPCNVILQNVTGGGNYCSGGTGVEVGLDGSETGVTYELYLDGAATGNVISGTGSAISFGDQTSEGTYTVVGHNVSEDCDLIMSGQADVVIVNTPGAATNPSPANGATSICFAGEGEITSISWNIVANATSYDVYFDEGSLPATVTANVSTTSYSIGTLNAGSTYYWKIVPKNSCGDATGESTWTFTTNDVPCYCSSGSTAYDLYESITNVTFAGINNSSPASKTIGYTDYSGTVSPAEVQLGQNYAIAVSNEFLLEEGYGGYCKVYIDFDQNGVFDTSTELVFESSYINNTTMTGTVTIPATAVPGLTRMRVIIEGDADNTGALPCGSFTWGEAEDYMVNISSLCTAAALPLLTVSSSTVCPGSDVTVTISGELNDATEWIIYSGSCGGTKVMATSTNSFIINDITSTATYFVRGEGSSCDDPNCGNITITVEDNTAPVADLVTLSDVTSECSVTSLTAPTATDNCAGTVSGTHDATLPITTQGTTVVTWTYDDGNGNTSTQTQNVVIDDVTDPTFTCPIATTVVFDASCQITIPDLISGISDETDNCGTPILSQSPVAGTVLSSGAGIVHTVIITADDGNGNTVSCDVEVTGVPAETIDIEVVDLGNSCQSGETGSTTNVTWDISKVSGTNEWTFNYEIKLGATTVASASNIPATGNTQVLFNAENETAQSKTFTLIISNVKDKCGFTEINTSNNTDSVTLEGLPDTSEINTN